MIPRFKPVVARPVLGRRSRNWTLHEQSVAEARKERTMILADRHALLSTVNEVRSPGIRRLIPTREGLAQRRQVDSRVVAYAHARNTNVVDQRRVNRTQSGLARAQTSLQKRQATVASLSQKPSRRFSPFCVVSYSTFFPSRTSIRLLPISVFR